MLNKLLERDTQNCVISVGGGLPVKEENRELLSQLGTVVYLWADADELVKRLSGDNTRPLLAGGNLKEKINTLMDARKEIYDSVSDIKIDTKDIAFNDMFSQMEEFLQKNMIDNVVVIYNYRKVNKRMKKILVINGPNINFLGNKGKRNIWFTKL